MWGDPLSPLMLQVGLMPLGLVSIQASLISHNTHSANLLLFQKAMTVIVIVDFVHIIKLQRTLGGREVGYAQDKPGLNMVLFRFQEFMVFDAKEFMVFDAKEFI